ncbi:glycosyltransferase [Sphaerisporangium sp. TRM90804]|uniref:glycosyltransferase n=1 Tax=Sphaerisporangium sp. TRM90804 TaxID=3031113 RepID=UPI002446E5AE|nr:glycosyltransferase [Sphaerisporangium sp. TRM90804]MDH2427108.1 glycosyltransferase [Sphaerisporangium sp. TRM90804]
MPDVMPWSADVAVIVPNYNKRKTLRACLDSVFAQTYPAAEVVVVDDVSTDGSLEIAREFPCAVVESRRNRGPAGARNLGVASTSAPLLFFVDSDTALAPDAIHNAVKAYRETPDCGMVQGIYDREPLYDDGPVERYRVLCEHYERSQTTATFLSCTLIPRHVFEEAGRLDERLRDGEDFEFGTRVPSRYRLVVATSVVTKADDEDRFWGCLAERFVRSTTLPVIMWRARGLREQGKVGFQLNMIGTGQHKRRKPPKISSASATATFLTLPLASLTPWLLAVPALTFGVFAWKNRRFIGFSRRHRGIRFALWVTWMQLCFHTAFFLGACAGLLRVAYELGRRQGDPLRTPLSPAPPAGARE